MKPFHLYAMLAGALLIPVMLFCCSPAHAEDIAEAYDPAMAATIVLTDDGCALPSDPKQNPMIKKWYALDLRGHEVTYGCWSMVGGHVFAVDADISDHQYSPKQFRFTPAAIKKYLGLPAM
jgi:hypothetical protein